MIWDLITKQAFNAGFQSVLLGNSLKGKTIPSFPYSVGIKLLGYVGGGLDDNATICRAHWVTEQFNTHENDNNIFKSNWNTY